MISELPEFVIGEPRTNGYESPDHAILACIHTINELVRAENARTNPFPEQKEAKDDSR